MAKRVTPWNPNTADWLVAQRGKRTQDEIVDLLAARGVKVKRAWLSRIENGQPFGAELLEAFQEFYGSVPPPFEPAPESVDQSDLVAAIDRQTAMLKAVLEALTSRLPAPPDDPQIQEAQAAWAEAERQLRPRRSGTSSPPRKPARERPREARGSASRTVEQSS